MAPPQDSKLESGEERFVYGKLIAENLASWALTLLASWTLTLSLDWPLKCGHWRMGNIGIRSANPFSIGCCSDRPKLLFQFQLININKLASRFSKVPAAKRWFY
jgi:hypothetical protein